MNESEFRVEVDLEAEEHGLSLGERLRSLTLDDEARDRLGSRAIVTRDGTRLFVYTASLEGAAEAERVIREILTDDEFDAEIRVTRWHPIAAAWKNASEPLPEDEEARAQELRDRDPEIDEDTYKHPTFVAIASYEPRFMRDLGI